MSTIVVKKRLLQEIVNQLNYVCGAIDSLYFNYNIDEIDNEDIGYLKAEAFLNDSTAKLKKLIDRTVD